MIFHNQNTVSLEDASGPDGIRVYAVGDIHGRIDLLLKMEALIQADIVKSRPSDWRIVYLGDYVDRGLCSRDVIEFLANYLWDERRIALAGNHDVGFVQFLEGPNTGDVFATCGGEETARSYGVEMPFGSYESFERLQDDHQRLLSAIPKAVSQSFQYDRCVLIS